MLELESRIRKKQELIMGDLEGIVEIDGLDQADTSAGGSEALERSYDIAI